MDFLRFLTQSVCANTFFLLFKLKKSHSIISTILRFFNEQFWTVGEQHRVRWVWSLRKAPTCLLKEAGCSWACWPGRTGLLEAALEGCGLAPALGSAGSGSGCCPWRSPVSQCLRRCAPHQSWRYGWSPGSQHNLSLWPAAPAVLWSSPGSCKHTWHTMLWESLTCSRPWTKQNRLGKITRSESLQPQFSVWSTLTQWLSIRVCFLCRFAQTKY